MQHAEPLGIVTVVTVSLYSLKPRLLPMNWRRTIRLHWLPMAVALASLVLIIARAAWTADPYWDTLAYHWPFAARLVDLCDRACFSMPPGIEARYDGFPLLWHLLQGLMWRITGTPAMADLLNIAMVIGLCSYLQLRFKVPFAWSWLAFLAIPEVQIQLTSSYIDLPLNSAVTLALMVLLRTVIEPSADQRADIAVGLLALGIAAGSKYQLVPIALATWLAITVVVTRKPSMISLRRSSTAFVALALAGAVVLLPKLVINTHAFGNPFYPLQVALGPIRFPGVESMVFANSVSDVWTSWPRGIRWLASVLEFDAFRGRPLPWTPGQGDVPQSSPAFRMGGYFVAYVVGAVGMLSWSMRLTPAAKWPGILMVLLTLICASLPNSHELRYYMFWMLTLVSCLLVMVHSPAFATTQQSVLRTFTHGLIAIAGFSVVMMTGAAYLKVDGVTLSELVAVTDETVAQVPDGGTLCILNRHPYAFLYASVFHQSRHYHTKSLFAEELANCTIRLDLDKQRGAIGP